MAARESTAPKSGKNVLRLIFLKGAQASRLFLPKQTAKMAVPPSSNTPKSIGDIMVFGQDQWAWGAHLRRAQRARRVRLRRKQPNQCNPTTWRR